MGYGHPCPILYSVNLFSRWNSSFYNDAKHAQGQLDDSQSDKDMWHQA